ncbi:MAG: WbqC family protein [Chloroflexota bacterium]
MRTAVIHQPNFLPGLTYFDKIDQADIFVILDNVQFVKRNWINRNKIKSPDGPMWITVPVRTKGKYTQSISETEIDSGRDWQIRHATAIAHSYSRSIYYAFYAYDIQGICRKEFASIAALNERLLRECITWLGIETPIVRASELGVNGTSTDLLLDVCEAVSADRYLSGPGGKKYMDVSKFAERGVQLEFHEYKHPEYQQRYGFFEKDMSICDLLFNEGRDSLKILRSGRKVHA